MEDSLTLQLQQAWLASQINKQPPLPRSFPPSPEPWSSPHPPPSFPDEDALMDPVLQYINDMLMDEKMDDRKCMMQECIAYQAMAKGGFYEILGENSSSPLTSCGSECSPSSNTESGEDYNRIDEVLNVDPQGASSAHSLKEEPNASTVQNGSLVPHQCELRSSASASQSESNARLASEWPFSSYGSGSQTAAAVPNYLGLQGSLFENAPGSNGSTSVTTQYDGLSDMSAYSNAPGSNGSTPVSTQYDGLSDMSAHSNAPQDPPNSLVGRSVGPLAGSGSSANVLSVGNSSFHWLLRSNETNGMISGSSADNGMLSQTALRPPLQSSENGRHRRATADSYSKSAGYSQKLEENHGYVVQQSQVFQPSVIPPKIPATCLFPGENSVSYVKNEILNYEGNAFLYQDGPLLVQEKRTQRVASKKSAPGANQEGLGNAATQKPLGLSDMVDLRALLVSCARAVAADDLRKASEILQDISQHSSPHGTAAQRLAHFFAEGLVARLSGTGPRLYTALTHSLPSAAEMLKTYQLYVEICPFVKVSHYFANRNILKAAEGASRLHIVDYGILYGFQWPCLMSVLAGRKGGPPHLRITGIDFPQPGFKPAERVEETGRRLSEYARTYGVPFEYQAVASKWEAVQPASLNLRHDEVLVVNCIYRLRHLMDETVIASSPRKVVLSKIRSMNPKIFVEGVVNGGFNAPFFMSRFREALFHFSSKFDILDTTTENDNPERLMIEKEILGRDILNVVACEGLERVERPETYRQWQARTQRAGFEMLPLDPAVISKAQAVVKGFYHKDFGVDEDAKWMLLAWKGRIMHALSVWKPVPVDGY